MFTVKFQERQKDKLSADIRKRKQKQ